MGKLLDLLCQLRFDAGRLVAVENTLAGGLVYNGLHLRIYLLLLSGLG